MVTGKGGYMNARQAGYLASRLFALYLIFQAVPTLLSLLARSLAKGAIYGPDDSPGYFFLTVIFLPVVMLICALFFWARADLVSKSLTLPAAATPDVPDEANRWEVLIFMAVGGLALSDLFVELSRLLATLMSYEKPTFGGPDLQFVSTVWTYSLHGLFSFLMAAIFLLTPRAFLRVLLALRRVDGVTTQSSNTATED